VPTHLLTVDEDGADQLVLLEQRHAQDGAGTRRLDKGKDAGILFAIGPLLPEVEDVERPFRTGNARERRIQKLA
jgi:hypothetical protein